MAAYAHTTAKICRAFLGLTVLWGIIGLSGVRSWASNTEYDRTTLRGLQGVEVILEDLKPEVERAWITKTQLQADVELRLRQAGIRVLTSEERLEMPGAPWLYIGANVGLKPDAAWVTFHITIELRQTVSLATDGSQASVSTWSVHAVGTTDRTRLDFIRNTVKDYLDRFINAYLSVHPRPTGSATQSPTSPRRDLIRQIQERLVEAGFGPRMPDGKLGPQTQEALRQFQRASNLPITGSPDQATLKALRVALLHHDL